LWLFRVVAVGLGLSVFPLFEALCIALGWGQPNVYDDPFVGFSAVQPLFVRDDEGTRYRIPLSRRKFFAPESFPVDKSPGTFRIFVLGGSTVQGHPYSNETSFTTWLQLALSAADPDRQWEVVNCGGVSYASYRLVPILQECLNYEPDLFIVCTGHNEFLEDRTYAHVKRGPLVGQTWLTRRRTFVLLQEGVRRLAGRSTTTAPDDRPVLPADADALLDYYDGLKAYHYDPAWHAGVIEHFEHNLRRMFALADAASVPVIAIREASNLADCPPFKSEHRLGLAAEQLAAWDERFQEAQLLYRTDVPRAVALLEEALRIDDQYAAAHYELGQCLETLGRYDAARTAYLQARDVDVCPLRMISPLEERLASVCRDANVPLLDAHALLESRTARGILGFPWVCDHVHPSFEGHQIIADALVERMAQQGLVRPRSDWRDAAHAAYRAHFASLDEMYFLRGQRTLNSVIRWTEGRAGGPPIETRAPHRLQHEEQQAGAKP
jgi:lysophospholipase L1-like esterase